MTLNRIFNFVAIVIVIGGMSGEVLAMVLETRAGISQKYDDNVTYVKENPIQDMSTLFLLGLEAKAESRRDAWDVAATVTQELFADNSDFNNTGQEFLVNYRREMSQYDTLLVNNRFSHTDEPRSFKDVLGRTAGRYDYFLNTFIGQRIHQFNEYWSMITEVNNEFYDPGRSDLARSVLNKGTVQVDYAFHPQTVVLWSYGYGVREFDPGKHISSHNPEFGLRRELAPKLSMETRVGPATVGREQKSVTKPRYLAILTLKDEARVDYSVLFLKEVGHSAFSEDVFDIWQVSANAVRKISRRLKGEGSIFYGKGYFLVSNEKEDFIGAALGASFELRKDITARGGYSFSRVDSVVPSKDYVKNTVSLSFEWRF